ncbi:ROK family transcriptional regulator [Microbacterium oxydans]|uniref:ROK family transcriptional regulator n=1 Tax=Microbacterium oxydans TaxID=82380 RepID=UPI000B852F23|nr:ROK family transcriptional regulator [Microbacterium oxydans]
MQRGSNLPAVGVYNQALVFDLIRRSEEGLSRSELAERTGLSTQTLSNVTRRLANEGLIEETGKVISGPGKPRTLLALRSDSRYAVGVHLDPAVDTVVVVDAAGAVVARTEQTPGGAEASPDELVGRLGDSVRSLILEARLPAERVLGIGVAAPGPFDRDAGRLLNPPLLPAWHNVSVRKELERVSGLPTLLEKDVVATVVGEQWFDAGQELADAMFLYYGAGLGLGLSVSGAPVHGRTGNAGNIAHIVVDPEGPLCTCGSRGCIGVIMEPRMLLAQAERTTPPSGTGDARMQLELLSSLAAAGDKGVLAALESAGRHLATAIVEVNNLLDLGIVVLGGPAWSRLGERLLPALDHWVHTTAVSTSTAPVQLRPSQMGADAAAVGAACLVLDDALTARPSRLMISR